MHLPIVTDRCTGHCCARFPLHTTAGGYFTHETFAARDPATVVDGEFIADMVIPLFGPNLETEPDQWTCRHFDGVDCAAYEQRPEMCRNHGVTWQCRQPACTLPGGRREPDPISGNLSSAGLPTEPERSAT